MTIVFVLAGWALVARPASAQLTSLGATDLGAGGTTHTSQFSDVAYDDKHDVFLVVWYDNDTVVGRFVAFDGSLSGSSFVIGTGVGTTRTIRVAYSKGTADDVFFVLFTRAGPSGVVQRVRYTGSGGTAGTLVGSSMLILATATRGNDVVFNPAARRFLVATENTDVVVTYLSPDGERIGESVNISYLPPGRSVASGTQALLAYDWQSNRYNARYLEPVDSGRGYPIGNTAVAKVLNATSLQPDPAWLTHNATGDTNESTGYLPESPTFMVTFACSAAGTGTDVCGWTGPATQTQPSLLNSASIDQNGVFDYDPYSRRVLVIGRSSPTSAASNAALVAAIADGTGQRIGESFLVEGRDRTGLDGLSVRASRGGQFAVTYLQGGSLWLERLSLPLASSPGPRFSNATAHLDGPGHGSSPGMSFLVGGWALDYGANASDGKGVDTVHVWAFPADGRDPIFLGEDHTFHERPDVAAAFGSHFGGSGFDVNVTGLPPGTYTVVAYAHSTLSGAFARGDAVTITVASEPVMNLDAPAPGHVSAVFALGGWAIDRGSGVEGPGIDTIHVYAFPSDGSPGIFLGVPEMGRPRPDIASIYGSQYLNSGFRMDVSTLPAGDYRVVAYAHSTVSNTFVTSQSADITVQAPVSNPQMALDGPANNAIVTQPFVAGGWAIDSGAPSGTGVDVIHVWAFPIVNGVVDVANGILVAQGATGQSRPDVGAVFGGQFTNSGYTFAINTLSPGEYVLGVYARSTVTEAFGDMRQVRINVQ